MFRGSRGRSAAATTALAVAAAAFVTAAFLVDGEAQAEVALNDSGVWVTKTSAGVVGRFNTQSQALDGVLLAGSPAFDVQQQAQRVLVTSGASGSPVDPAHLELSGMLRAPDGAAIASGGAAAAVLDPKTGRLWVLPFDAATGFDPDGLDPVATLPEGSRALAVTLDGTVLAAGPGTLVSVPTTLHGVPGDVRQGDLDTAPGAELEVTAVGKDPVVLDRSEGRLLLPGGDAVELPDAADARLQQVSRASDHVLVATPSGLVSQPLGGGPATVRDAAGVPAAPVQLGGCSYGAWSQTGQVLRDCAGTDADVDETLEGLGATSLLAYRVNRDAIVLNDLAAGTLWMAAQNFEMVDDWDQTMPDDADAETRESEESTPELVDQVVAPRDQPNRPPRPKDDQLGVRAGRTTILDVLGNDVDPDGDVMTASVSRGIDGLPVVPVLGGAALQVTVPAGATGGGTLEYTASDGRGGDPKARATLRIVPDGENSPPVQTGDPVLKVGRGASATIDVLPYFRDPEGDDLVLSAAGTTATGEEVSFAPDGTVTLRDGGAVTGRLVVDLVVTDALGASVDGRLLVDVVADDVAPVPVNDRVTVQAGQAVTVEPLANDADPNGDELHLVSVSEQASATVEVNAAAGTFRFTSTRPGSYDLAYQVSDGPNVATGLVRVDVLAPPESSAPPVVVADRVLLPAGGSALVDVLANDTDSAGGVLVVQSVQVPPDAGLSVAVLAHHVVKVTEVRRLAGPVMLTYTVSNGATTATGQVRVLPVPAPERLRAPDAEPDDAVVHAGDVVTIPVLRNDTHPDGLELALAPDLVEDPEEGEAFVAEGTVRYKAGHEAATVHLVYAVTDPNGQQDSAQVTIHVLAGAENAAPQLADVEARVLAGGTVQIPLPLDGADPDGDLVTLDGVASPPRKGSVDVTDGGLRYTASATESGADTFTYRVSDTRGATALGTVRVGIAVPAGTNQPPVAVDDALRVRPGRTVAIDAVANDSDPDGDPLGLVDGTVEGADPLSPKVVDGKVVVTTPAAPGVHTFYYGVEDPFAARATGAVTVDVDPEAPLLRPVARDDVVTSADVSGVSVTVPVLANDADPDGTVDDLTVSVDAAETAAGVRVAGASLVVPLGPSPRVLTYTVTDRDGLAASAFVRVPRDGTAPRLREGLDLTITAGDPLTLDLEKIVEVAAGRTPRLTSESQVAANPGRRDVTGVTSIDYTSPAEFTGTAWVTFEVADGEPGAKDTRTAVLSAPVTVTAARNKPPVFSGRPSLEVAAGEEASVDVARFVTDPEGDPLTLKVTGDADPVTTAVSGTTVSGQVDPDVPKGTRATVQVEVSDGVNPPVAGQVDAAVVASTRPLARAADDVVDDAHHGEDTPVDVLANDANPFEGRGDLTLLAAVVETGQGTAAVDGDRVVVTPSADFVGRMVVRYRVADVTGDPDREVEGRVQLTVLGEPEAPALPRVEEVRSETVVLSWEPPVDNGAPITGYTVSSDQGTTADCPTTTCTITGLTNTVDYTFTVVAVNEVGPSKPSPASETATPDASPDPPAAPTLVFGDKSLAIEWTVDTYTDRSAVECVNLEISPAPADGATVMTCVPGTTATWDGLANGTAYRVRAQAVNEAPDPSAWGEWSAPETPAGPPAAPAKPTATRVSTALGGEVTVTWEAPDANGDAIDSYWLGVYAGSTEVASYTPTQTSQTVQGLDTSTTYTFRVRGLNKGGEGALSPATDPLVPYGTPATPGTPTAALGTDTNGKANVSWPAIAASGFHGPGGYYRVQANGANPKKLASPAVYTGLTNGTDYTFQVQACNAYACSPWSASSGAVNPYTLPGPITVSWVRIGGDDGQFRWNTPADDGGRRVTRVEYTVSGDQNWSTTHDFGAAGASEGYGWFPADVEPGVNRSFTFTGRGCSPAGCGPWVTASGSTASQAGSVVQRTSRGGAAPTGLNGCGGSCSYVGLDITGAPPDTALSFRCYADGSPFSDYTNTVTNQTAGVSNHTDAQGRFHADIVCAYGRSGAQVQAFTNVFGLASATTW